MLFELFAGDLPGVVVGVQQVVSFHCQSQMPCDQILSQLRRYLPEDIGIYSCREVADRFHARLNAKEKTYLYRIWNSEKPCVFQRKYCWVLKEQLDIQAMQDAAKGCTCPPSFPVCVCGKKPQVQVITRKPIVSTDEELERNPRARSAKLRVCEKV